MIKRKNSIIIILRPISTFEINRVKYTPYNKAKDNIIDTPLDLVISAPKNRRTITRFIITLNVGILFLKKTKRGKIRTTKCP